MARAAEIGWLESPPVDLTLILGVTVLACAMGGAVAAVPALFFPLLVFHTWCFSFDHAVATFTRLAGLPEDRRKNRFLIFALPPLLFAATMLVGQRGGVGAIATGYFFFQWFHTVRQSWGIAQTYRRAAGRAEPRWFSQLTIWSVPAWGLLLRCHQQPARFLGMELRLPAVPRGLVDGVGLAAVFLLVCFVWTRWLAWRRGELSLPHALYLTTHFLVFALAYLVIDDLHAGWLLVNVWHNVQYLAWVWIHNRSRFSDGVRPDAPILSWLCQRGRSRAVLYFGGLLVISAALFGSIYALLGRLDLWLDGRVISISLVFALALNFHHYLVDGLIWRNRVRAR